MDFFLKTKSLTHFFKVIWYVDPKSNVCKLRNGVFLSLFASFQDGRHFVGIARKNGHYDDS